jgi:hypothetical protein
LDEGRISEDDLKLRADNLSGRLFRLEQAASPESLAEEVTALGKMLGGEKYRTLRRAFAAFIDRVIVERLATHGKITEASDILEMEGTMLEQTVSGWTEDWMRQGELKGKLEGKQNILLRLLAKRFGQDILGGQVRDRVKAASPEQLDLLVERILEAKTVEELFS